MANAIEGSGGGATRPAPAKRTNPTTRSGVRKPIKKTPASSAARKSVTLNSNGLSVTQVKALQRKLGIPADGKYGPQTRAAVRSYQSRNGLAVDGIAGRQTLGKMGLSGGSSSGGSTAARPATAAKKPATTAKPANWENSAEGKAANFGWSLAVINSNPELKKIFGLANKENWTPDRFVAKVRDTKWFKTTSATARQALILQKADPATYNARINSLISSARAQGDQMGAQLTAGELKGIASQALMMGWNQEQIKAALAGHVEASKNTGNYSGQAGAAAVRFEQMAHDYGVKVTPSTLATWVKGNATGRTSEEYVKQYLMDTAASRFPALADRIKSGQTLMQIADPYIQSYAKTLEINGESINLNDAHIQNALSGKDASGKPQVKSVWQFEQDLRQDPRFMKTQQAQDQSMAVAHKVLQDFGFSAS